MNRQTPQDDSSSQQQHPYQGSKQRPEADQNYIYQQQRQQYYLQQQMRGQAPRQAIPSNYYQSQQYSGTQRQPSMSYQDQQQIIQQQQQASIQQQQVNQQSNQLIGPIDIKGLTQKISTKEVLDQQVEKTLASLAEDFVKTVAEFSCKLAKHRGSDTLEKEDIKFAIEKLYNIPTPIKPSSDKQVNAALTQQQIGQVSTSNYKQNLSLIKKANEQSGNI